MFSLINVLPQIKMFKLDWGLPIIVYRIKISLYNYFLKIVSIKAIIKNR